MDAPHPASNSHGPPGPAAPPARLKVLLVEDNAGDARLIERMLAESGGREFELERVVKLADGLARLAAGGIALVLLDLSLPDSQGLETFTRLHAGAPTVPAIVLSGLNDERVAVQAVQAGAQDYLVKGQVDGPLLGRAMRYAIERERTAEQLARYAGELRARNAQMEADINMAREIQEAFLPYQYPAFPPAAASSALRFCHRYLPAAAVGGDFFNIFALSDTTAGIFICDVVGHGMRAALITAILRGVVEELKPVAGDPGTFLTEINHSLHAILQRADEPLMATAYYLVVDTAAGELRFASAGHPSPLRVRRGDGATVSFKSLDARHGPALGLFGGSTYPTCRAEVVPDDLIMLFTDGLYEVEGPDHQEFGHERLLAAVRRRAGLPAAQLFDELLAEVKQFSGGKPFADDVCLVGMEIMPR